MVGRRGDSIPPLHGTISILIGSYPGGSLSDLASQALKDSVINGKATTAEPVSGLGDQAYFGAVTGSLSFSGITLRQKQQALAVVDGIMVFLVNAGLSTEQAALAMSQMRRRSTSSDKSPCSSSPSYSGSRRGQFGVRSRYIRRSV